MRRLWEQEYRSNHDTQFMDQQQRNNINSGRIYRIQRGVRLRNLQRSLRDRSKESYAQPFVEPRTSFTIPYSPPRYLSRLRKAARITRPTNKAPLPVIYNSPSPRDCHQQLQAPARIQGGKIWRYLALSC